LSGTPARDERASENYPRTATYGDPCVTDVKGRADKPSETSMIEQANDAQ
jgi:hypothetical protein